MPGLPRDIETIAIKCLRKDPGKRYGSALALADDLARFQAGETILARPVGVPERGWRWCRRNPALAWSLGAVAAAVLALAGLSLLYANQQVHFAEKQDEARKEADLQLAISDFERGETLCEKGELGTGLLRLIASWQAAREADRSILAKRGPGQPLVLAARVLGAQGGLLSSRPRRTGRLQPGRPDRHHLWRRSHGPALERRHRPAVLPAAGAQGARHRGGVQPRRQDRLDRQLRCDGSILGSAHRTAHRHHRSSIRTRSSPSHTAPTARRS